MEKRALLAAILCALFLAFYSQTLATHPTTKPSTPQQRSAAQRPQEPPAAPPQLLPHPLDGSFMYPIEKEDVVSINSEKMTLDIGRSSGSVRRIALKGFLDETKTTAVEFGGTLPLIRLQIGQSPLIVASVASEGNRAVVEVEDAEQNKYHILYELNSDKPLINIVVMNSLGQQNSGQADLRLIVSWSKGDKLLDQHNRLESFVLEEKNGGKVKYRHFSSPWKKPIDVPRGTPQLSLAERYFCQSIKPRNAAYRAVMVPSPEGTAAAEMRFPIASQGGGGELFSASVYVGPRDYFHLKRAGFSEAFHIGIIGQIGLVLLLMLSWIAKLIHNYGVAVILFSGLVTCAMAPFTLLGFRSMKRMQELKPKIDKLMAQHKGDSQRANKEVFALYKEHRINPLGGCLPMLLQMPIFIALFQGISHFIELRGASFLWIKDLSLPDRIAQLPIGLPFLGKDVNLLPVIMAAAMYFQTKASQQSMGAAESNPTAKMMSGPLMPIMFFFMFYQFPAGLVLYWLTNTVISMMWYRLAK